MHDNQQINIIYDEYILRVQQINEINININTFLFTLSAHVLITSACAKAAKKRCVV